GPNANLGNDTFFCKDDSIELSCQLTPIISWSVGSASTKVNIKDTGLVWLTLRDQHGCTDQDTVHIGMREAVAPQLSNRPIKCPADTASINCTYANARSFLWNTGETTATIITKDSGNFVLQLRDKNNCSSTASTHIANYNIAPLLLGPDTFVCQGRGITLRGSYNHALDFAWN